MQMYMLFCFIVPLQVSVHCFWIKDLADPLFLALLDYVSRAHEIKIRPSYVIRRPSVASIISEVTAWIAFKFQLWLLLDYSQNHFFHF